MLDALYELHLAGFVHRDVKPDHFRIGRDHVVKLLDFDSVDYFIR